MSDLDADIARIAALRGHDPAAVARKAAEIEKEGRRIPIGLLHGLFTLPPDPRMDLKALDRLPPASRTFVVECPVAISAIHYAQALAIAQDEGQMIATLRPMIEAELAYQARRHFGPEHPGARKTA